MAPCFHLALAFVLKLPLTLAWTLQQCNWADS